MEIILLGPPGAGKGTQAKRLELQLHVPHIASGDIFRAIRREETPLANEVRGYMDRGEYVPDGLTIKLVLGRLDEADTQSGFILDGFPRTEPQAEALDKELAREGRSIDRVIHITAPTDVLVSRVCGRLTCPNCTAIYNLQSKPPKHDEVCDVCGHNLQRRSDEEPEVVRTRLDTYIRQTAPLVEYYRRRGILSVVEGIGTMLEVQRAVDASLGLSTVG